MRKAFIDSLVSEARKNENIYLIVADLGYSVVEPFMNEFPDRFINVGIAEQNAMGIAAGLALTGKKVFIYSIIPFVTLRCLEQIKVDICYMNLDVTIVGVGSGFSYGPAGTTHHALEDISIMRSLPNISIFCPCDPNDCYEVFKQCFIGKNPNYIRLGSNKKNLSDIKNVEKTEQRLICKGNDLLILSLGSFTSYVIDNIIPEYKKNGLDVTLISCQNVKPFHCDSLASFINNGKKVIIIEDHFLIGGLFTIVLEYLHGRGLDTRSLSPINLGSEYTHVIGSNEFLIKDRLNNQISKKER